MSQPSVERRPRAGARIGDTSSLAQPLAVLSSRIHTISRSLEEAAQSHGASRFQVLTRVLLPLSVPGLAVGGLMIFTMCMGALTSAALLGSGRILTLPVRIQQTVMMQVNYALAVVVSLAVMLISLMSLPILRRTRAGRVAIL